MLKLYASAPLLRRPLGLLGQRMQSTSRRPTGFSLDVAGLLTDLYVPPVNPPSLFTSPKLRWTVFKRNMQMLGINTYLAVKVRRELGREHFNPLEWKEFALLLYERTNECFAQRDLAGLQKVASRWVYGPLAERMKELDAACVYDWKLLRLNKRPKVLSMVPLAFPDMPLHYVQTVYRIDSTQQLTKTNRKTGETQSQQRRVVDNVAFMLDARKDPLEGRLIGSLFETRPQMPMPDMAAAATAARADAIAGMRVRGDIFRPEPEYLSLKNDR